jgi:hypothetical protein
VNGSKVKGADADSTLQLCFANFVAASNCRRVTAGDVSPTANRTIDRRAARRCLDEHGKSRRPGKDDTYTMDELYTIAENYSSLTNTPQAIAISARSRRARMTVPQRSINTT